MKLSYLKTSLILLSLIQTYPSAHAMHRMTSGESASKRQRLNTNNTNPNHPNAPLSRSTSLGPLPFSDTLVLYHYNNEGGGDPSPHRAPHQAEGNLTNNLLTHLKTPLTENELLAIFFGVIEKKDTGSENIKHLWDHYENITLDSPRFIDIIYKILNEDRTDLHWICIELLKRTPNYRLSGSRELQAALKTVEKTDLNLVKLLLSRKPDLATTINLPRTRPETWNALMEVTKPEYMQRGLRPISDEQRSEIRKKRLQVVKLLLDFGANPNFLIGRPTYFSGYSKAQREILKAPLFYMSPLLSALRMQDLELVQLLIDSGADLNYQDPTEGTTLLMATLSHKTVGPQDLAAFQLILNANINHAQENYSGMTVLDILRNDPARKTLTYEAKTIWEEMLKLTKSKLKALKNDFHCHCPNPLPFDKNVITHILAGFYYGNEDEDQDESSEHVSAQLVDTKADAKAKKDEPPATSKTQE